MTTGRYAYAPAPEKRSSRRALLLVAIPIIVCAVFWARALQDQAAKPTPAPAPSAYAVTEQQLVDLRLQAFRAGWASAVQQGCRVTLASPIGGQP